tara:strand:+ start:1861 stop:2079 length:219 start_codon:yes stop_codon:yes gene_type:complete
MLISDLKENCKNCKGTGFLVGHKDWDGIQTNFNKFCYFCSGRGFVFTELGKKLWELYLPDLKMLIHKEIKKK